MTDPAAPPAAAPLARLLAPLRTVLRRLQHPVKQLQPPGVAVDAMLALLGVDLDDSVIAIDFHFLFDV